MSVGRCETRSNGLKRGVVYGVPSGERRGRPCPFTHPGADDRALYALCRAELSLGTHCIDWRAFFLGTILAGANRRDCIESRHPLNAHFSVQKKRGATRYIRYSVHYTTLGKNEDTEKQKRNGPSSHLHNTAEARLPACRHHPSPGKAVSLTAPLCFCRDRQTVCIFA